MYIPISTNDLFLMKLDLDNGVSLSLADQRRLFAEVVGVTNESNEHLYRLRCWQTFGQACWGWLRWLRVAR